MKPAIVAVVFHPGEPLVLQLLFEDSTHERHVISRGTLRNLLRQSAHAVAMMYETDEAAAKQEAARHHTDADHPVPVR